MIARIFALVAAVSLLLAATRAQAAAFDVNDATWEGCLELLEMSREVLGTERVVVLTTLDWEQLDAVDGVLILHPTEPLDADEATAFMKAGGRLAIVDDYGDGESLLAHFDIERRNLPARPIRYLRGRPQLPIAEPIYEAGDRLRLHPTVAHGEPVALNHGTGLRHPDLTPVLRVRGRDDESVPVAVAGRVEEGRLFVMGDPSALINQMMRYPGNRAFAEGLVRYLADGDSDAPRKGRLFIVANGFLQRGSFGGVTPLSKQMDRKLDQLLEGYRELRDDGFPWWLHLVVAAVAGLLLLWWAMRRLVRLYRARAPHFARHTPLVAQGGVSGRAAVLSSPASPPALALLELKSALREALSWELESPPSMSLSQLIQRAVDEAILPAHLVDELGRALRTMESAETAVLAESRARLSKADVLRVGRVVERALDCLA